MITDDGSPSAPVDVVVTPVFRECVFNFRHGDRVVRVIFIKPGRFWEITVMCDTEDLQLIWSQPSIGSRPRWTPSLTRAAKFVQLAVEKWDEA